MRLGIHGRTKAVKDKISRKDERLNNPCARHMRTFRALLTVLEEKQAIGRFYEVAGVMAGDFGVLEEIAPEDDVLGIHAH